MIPHPWDDLEQRFLRFTTTLKEILNAIAAQSEDPKIPSEVADSIMNMTIGAEAYVSSCENIIADAMESKISNDYSKISTQQTTGVLIVGENGQVQIPSYLINLLGWAPGDKLKWQITDDNSVLVSKVDK